MGPSATDGFGRLNTYNAFVGTEVFRYNNKNYIGNPCLSGGFCINIKATVAVD